MRPLHHPPIDNIRVEDILHAFSHPARIRIFMDLAEAECAKNCTSYMHVNKQPLAKSTLSQHFRILREAGLIYSERSGVELHNRTRCKELKAKFGDMISAIIDAYVKQQKKKKRAGTF